MNVSHLTLTYLAHCVGIHLDDRAILNLTLLTAGSFLLFGLIWCAGKNQPHPADRHKRKAP